MNPAIKEQIQFVLEDDNELMSAALTGDWDEENKQMNRELIQRHKRYDGDVTNRNCVRCNHPRQYRDFEHFDAGDDKGG